MKAIEAPSSENTLPWQTHSEQRLVQTQTNRPLMDPRLVDELAKRVDNVGKRLKRVETLDTTNEGGLGRDILPPVHDLLERLRYTRGCIQDQVAVVAGVSTEQSRSHEDMSETDDPDTALRMELENWRRLDGQIQQEVIHNRSIRPELGMSILSAASPVETRTATRSSSWASTSTSGSDTSARRGSSRRHSSQSTLPRPTQEVLDRRIAVKM